MKIYVASSWRNRNHPEVVDALRNKGFDVYDYREPVLGADAFHWSKIEKKWKKWSPQQFIKGLSHPKAVEGFRNDFEAMEDADACVLVLPSGRSAHLEAGWFVGAGKPLCILLDSGEPELMYAMTPELHTSIPAVIRALKKYDMAKPKP